MKLRRAAMATVAVALASTAAIVVSPGIAAAHGAMMSPGSRTYLCWKDGLVGTNGAINPKNPACAAAVATSGVNSLYNWFAVLRSDAGGRTTGFIPDGQLCSGGTGGPYDFTGFNLARDDWPVTHLTSGSTIEIDYSNWANHPGTFYLYLAKDGYDPTKPLAWSDLEQFDAVTNPAQTGSSGTDLGHYYWKSKLPAGKSGRSLIYSRWVRSDSKENFFGCSDVVFDGGKGEVTGVGTSSTGGSPSGQSQSSKPAQSSKPVQVSSGPSKSSQDEGTGCAATLTVASSWQGGYQAKVDVRNTGTSAISGWAVTMAMASGANVAQVWNGSLMTDGTTVMVHNTAYNGSLNAKGSTSFGFIASGTAGAPAVSCSVG